MRQCCPRLFYVFRMSVFPLSEFVLLLHELSTGITSFATKESSMTGSRSITLIELHVSEHVLRICTVSQINIGF